MVLAPMVHSPAFLLCVLAGTAGSCSQRPAPREAASVSEMTLATDEDRGGGEPLPDLDLGLMRDASASWEKALSVPASTQRFQLRVRAERGRGETRVRVNWQCCERLPNHFLTEHTRASEEFELDHPFAALEFLPDGRLVISGVELGTRWPLFEIWTFADAKVEIGESGNGPFRVGAPDVRCKVTTRASGDDESYGCGQCLFASPGLPTATVWMLTFPEYDLRRLDLLTGASTVMLSPQADVAAMQPWRDGERDWSHGFYAGRHLAFGDVYWLSMPGGDVGPGPGTFEGVVFFDEDLDGWLDEARSSYAGDPWQKAYRDPEQWGR